MNVYTGYNLAVKDTIYFIYNKIHWYHEGPVLGQKLWELYKYETKMTRWVW